MNRIIAVVSLLIFTLCGGAQDVFKIKQEVLPSEIIVGTSILSYYDSTPEEFKNAGLAVAKSVFPVDGNCVRITDDKVRCIIIHDNSITAFKGITIGDSVYKLHKLYKNVKFHDNFWYLYFKGNTEIDADKSSAEVIKNNPEDYICISGTIENNRISSLSISDFTYATTGK